MIHKISIKGSLILALTTSVFAGNKGTDLGDSWIQTPGNDLNMSFLEVPNAAQNAAAQAALPEPVMGINGLVTDYELVDQGDGFVVRRAVQKNKADLIRQAAEASDKAYGLYLNNNLGNTIDGFVLYQAGKGYQGDKVFFRYGGMPECYVTYTTSATGKPVITVAFRGSKELVLDHLQTNAQGNFGDNFYSHGNVQGTVHKAINQRYLQSRDGIMEVISSLLEAHGKTISGVKVVVTGHSLGGGLATVAAADLKQRLAAPKFDLVTFNAPRIFNSVAAEAAEKILGKEHMIRVTREGDPISQLGPSFLGYQHAGTSIHLEAKADGRMPNHKHAHNIADATGNQAVHPVNKQTDLSQSVFLKKQEQIQEEARLRAEKPSLMSRLFGWTGLVK